MGLPLTTAITISLREKCPNAEFFLVRTFRIRTEYGEIWSISRIQFQYGKKRTRKNSVFGQFSHSIYCWNCLKFSKQSSYIYLFEVNSEIIATLKQNLSKLIIEALSIFYNLL